jgi:ferrochelatase
VVDKLRLYIDHPGFIEPMADRVLAAREHLGAEHPALVFTAHSVPLSMARTGPYVAQLTDAARLVAQRAAPDLDWALVWQSRSGPPTVPWLEPDVGDHLEELRARGVAEAVLVPIGFVSDHLEVRYDLDIEARERAHRLGMRLARAATVGADPRFVAMVAELVAERTAGAPRRALGAAGPWPDVCPADCCPPPRRPVETSPAVSDPVAG